MISDLAAITKRYVITGTVTAQTAFRIGSQSSFEITSSDLPVIRDVRGLPMIPGSSFKGVLRSTLESVIRGLGNPPGKRLWSCDPLEHPCTADFKGKSKQPTIESILDTCCDVCLLFGSPYMASRLLIKDLCIEKDLDRPPVEVRDHVAIERDTLTALSGGKFDQEVVHAGTQFGLEIVFENPNDAQIGLLGVALETVAASGGIGGSRSRGLGSVSIDINRVDEWSAKQLLSVKPDAVSQNWSMLIAQGKNAVEKMLNGGSYV